MSVLQERGTLALAEGLCLRLLDYGASSKERARALLREIRSLQVYFQEEGEVQHLLIMAQDLSQDQSSGICQTIYDRIDIHAHWPWLRWLGVSVISK